jgi:hypothetical protein
MPCWAVVGAVRGAKPSVCRAPPCSGVVIDGGEKCPAAAILTKVTETALKGKESRNVLGNSGC